MLSGTSKDLVFRNSTYTYFYRRKSIKMDKIKTLLLTICILLFSNLLFSQAANEISFAVYSTTDMHGRFGTEKNSIDQVAAVIKKEKDRYSNTLIIDNGDLIQGTIGMKYASSIGAAKLNPMYEAVAAIGYDAIEMGNHEFNFSPEYRDAQLKMLSQKGVKILGGGNIVLKEDGVNFNGEKVSAGSPFYDPYFIKTFESGNNKVRVAVIGLGNTANANWDREKNFPNLQFSNLENKTEKLENDINKWSTYIYDNDLADIIIVTAHTGKFTDDGKTSTAFLKESQITFAVPKSHYINLVIYGHDHQQNIETLTNAEGNATAIVNGGGTSVTKSIFTVNFDDEGNITNLSIENNLLAIKNETPDPAVAKNTLKYEKQVQAWAAKPFAKFGKGWTEKNIPLANQTNDYFITEQHPLINLITQSMIWSTWQTKGTEGATVAFVSPIFAKNPDETISYIPKDGDPISINTISKLYRYETNITCIIEMTGPQILAWMNANANNLEAVNGLTVLAKDASIYGIDTIYGIEYEYDLTKPKNKRVTKALYNEIPLAEYKDKIKVAMTTYRAAGGYDFTKITGLSDKDAIWTSDEFFPASKCSTSDLLGEYLRTLKTPTPDAKLPYAADCNWKIITNK